MGWMLLNIRCLARHGICVSISSFLEPRSAPALLLLLLCSCSCTTLIMILITILLKIMTCSVLLISWNYQLFVLSFLNPSLPCLEPPSLPLNYTLWNYPSLLTLNLLPFPWDHIYCIHPSNPGVYIIPKNFFRSHDSFTLFNLNIHFRFHIHTYLVHLEFKGLFILNSKHFWLI